VHSICFGEYIIIAESQEVLCGGEV
jgi:hypothetical protein